MQKWLRHIFYDTLVSIASLDNSNGQKCIPSMSIGVPDEHVHGHRNLSSDVWRLETKTSL